WRDLAEVESANRPRRRRELVLDPLDFLAISRFPRFAQRATQGSVLVKRQHGFFFPKVPSSSRLQSELSVAGFIPCLAAISLLLGHSSDSSSSLRKRSVRASRLSSGFLEISVRMSSSTRVTSASSLLQRHSSSSTVSSTTIAHWCSASASLRSAS